MIDRKTLNQARRNTRAIYERQAEQFDKDRTRTGGEEKWLDIFLETIPSGGHILDLGCGMGEPVAAYMSAQGYSFTGLDYSEPMLAIARKRLPHLTWVLNDMRDFELKTQYDGIISWHGSFHLTQDEQRDLIPRLAKHLKRSAVLMLTVGPEAGEVTGTVGGETVYHASLDNSEYRSLLRAEGFTEISFLSSDTETSGPYVLFAKR